MSFQLFYQCAVLSTDDPLMLGRIRARRLIDNYDDILKGISDPPWNESVDAWTFRDPFVFSPLLPYYLYQTPQAEEMVLGMFLTSDVKFTNQYYIQSTFYSPTATKFQYFYGANKFMGTGGQILPPKPLKNNDGTYSDKKKHKGVFPEPGDNSLLGRGSADVIVKKDEVLIRSGKYLGSSLKPNVLPTGDIRRGFLQLSRFDTQTVRLPNKKIKYIKELNIPVKYLIEYHIENPENTMDKFSGYVFLYRLKQTEETFSSNLTVSSKISDKNKTLITRQDFTNLTKQNVINFINDFIGLCDNKNVSNDGVRLFSTVDKYPIYYRPQQVDYQFMTNPNSYSPNINNSIECIGNIVKNNGKCFLTIKLVKKSDSSTVYEFSAEGNCIESVNLYTILVTKVMSKIDEEKLGYIPIPTFQEVEQGIPPQPQDSTIPSTGIVQKNIADIFNKIKLNSSATDWGYGMIYKKGVVGKPTKIESKTETQTDTMSTYTTHGALGSDYVYLLSHKSSIPGKEVINFDDTLYGIPPNKFSKDIQPNTSSMVRGEELLELLNLMYTFITTHTHPFPGRAPCKQTTNDMRIETLDEAMQNAVNTILNSYIRIN